MHHLKTQKSESETTSEMALISPTIQNKEMPDSSFIKKLEKICKRPFVLKKNLTISKIQTKAQKTTIQDIFKPKKREIDLKISLNINSESLKIKRSQLICLPISPKNNQSYLFQNNKIALKQSSHKSLSHLFLKDKNSAFRTMTEIKQEEKKMKPQKSTLKFGNEETKITISKSANFIKKPSVNFQRFDFRTSSDFTSLKKETPNKIKFLKPLKNSRSYREKDSQVMSSYPSKIFKEANKSKIFPEKETEKNGIPRSSINIYKTVFMKNEPKNHAKLNNNLEVKNIKRIGRVGNYLSPQIATNFINNQKTESLLNQIELINLSLLPKNEEFLFQFLQCFHEQSDIFELFNRYIDWIEENDFQPFLDFISIVNSSNAAKVALICERMSLLIIFYLYTKGLYKTEIIFIKKTIMHVYKNFLEFQKSISSILREIDEFKKMPKIINRDLTIFGSELPSFSVETNNDKILKILEVEIQAEEKEIFDSFHKLKKLMDDFTLNESWSYFKTTFISIVK